MDRSGLTMESAKILTEKEGARVVSRKIGGVKITDIRLNEIGAGLIGREPGRYITLEGQPTSEGFAALLRRAIVQLVPPKGKLLAVGLGNPDITQDSLGANTLRRITVRRSRRYSVFGIETDVAARTGIDSARLVKAAANEIGADCVIAIDALSCENPRYIGGTVQLSDCGIIPGSGVGAKSGKLSRKTLGVTVVAAGVPTVANLAAVTGNAEDSDFHITAGNIDLQIDAWSDVIAKAIDGL